MWPAGAAWLESWLPSSLLELVHSIAENMFDRFTLVGAVALSSLALHAQATTNSTPQALNPQLTNIVPNAPGGPTLYYNGSGPVPPYNETSPIPTPITPYNSTSMIEDAFFNEISGLVNGSSITNNCTQCLVGLELAHIVAITQPVETVVDLLIRA